MALATKTIQDSINWVKRFNFERNPVIGNSLEPALTSATLVAQTMLAPPFEYWWNNEELVFTCNPTPSSATATAISIASGVITVTAANTFAKGTLLLPSAVVSPLTALNGLILEVLSATSSQFTANVNLPNATGTVGVFTNLTTQDYTIPTPEFSHIEHASILDLKPAGGGLYTPNKWFGLTVKNNLSLETSANRPEFIGPHTEDGAGNTTFRVTSAPDKPYPVSIHIQLAAPTFTSINQTWAPIPDFMQYIYNYGFLALMWQFSDDPSRAVWANNKFTAGILSRADGLTQEEKNIFLNNWDAVFQNPMQKQQAVVARGQ